MVRRARRQKPAAKPDAATRHAEEAKRARVAASSRRAEASSHERAADSGKARPRPFGPPPVGSQRAAGIASFLRLPVHDDPASIPGVDVLISGVPYDSGSAFRPGARFGPRAVREASAFSNSFSQALGVDVFGELAAADGGDVVAETTSVESTLEAVAERARAVAASGVIPGFVGGDCTLTLGALRGLRRSKHKALNALFIGPNPAAWNAPGREPRALNFVRHAVSEGLIRPECTMQVGLRGPYPAADALSFAFSQGIDTVGVDEVRWDLHAVVSQVRRLVQKGSLYVSVDIAALDPAFAPGASFPVAGGMTTWDLQQILRALVGTEIAGFDVVEIAPGYDPTGITELAGVAVLHEILAAIADTRRSARPAPSTHKSGRAGRRSA
jgi:arginase family enzyme